MFFSIVPSLATWGPLWLSSGFLLQPTSAALKMPLRGKEVSHDMYSIDRKWHCNTSSFRGFLPVLHCPVSQPAVHSLQLLLHVWHLLHQLGVFVQGRRLWWQLCCWFWSLLCHQLLHLWLHHLHQHDLHQEPRLPQLLHREQRRDVQVHNQQGVWRYLSAEAGLPDILWHGHWIRWGRLLRLICSCRANWKESPVKYLWNKHGLSQ